MDKLIDCHCHLPHYGEKVDFAIQELARQGLKACAIGGVNPSDWLSQKKINGQLNGIQVYKSFGLHPCYVAKTDINQLETDFQILETMLESADALGEIGLDYAIAKSSAQRQRQMYWFELQLNLALSSQKAIVLHVVRAHHDMLPALKRAMRRSNLRSLPCMAHSFTGNESIVQSYLELGVFLSLSPQSLKSLDRAVIGNLPLNRLLIESDAPPHPHSEDVDVKEIAKLHFESLLQGYERVAKIHGVSCEELINQIESNIGAFFRQ
jgi:TatD DNase family protein